MRQNINRVDCLGRLTVKKSILSRLSYDEWQRIGQREVPGKRVDTDCVSRCNEQFRDTIENVIKEFHLDRSRIFEVSHLKYADIIKRIEKTFVINSGPLHWSNIGNRFQPSFALKTRYIGNHRLWYHMLDKIIPDTLHYVLFEDTVDFQPKYWVYEMFPNEMITVIDESDPSPDDFYIVSKKFEWLISECHEDIVYFVGDGIDISLIEGE